MEFLSETPVWLLFALIVIFRIIDVSLGTMRTIAVVKGRVAAAVFCGFFETSVWVIAVSQVITKINSEPWLILAYATGFATGNAVGIHIERKLAWGAVGLFMISKDLSDQVASALWAEGIAVTTIPGKGLLGPKTMIYCVCERKDLKRIVNIARKIDYNVFYATESISDYSRLFRAPGSSPPNATPFGLRSMLRKKK